MYIRVYFPGESLSDRRIYETENNRHGFVSDGCGGVGRACSGDYRVHDEVQPQRVVGVLQNSGRRGMIHCDNGQKATVRLSVRGGGLTAGKTEIRDGMG